MDGDLRAAGLALGEGWRSAEHWLGRASAIVGGGLLLVIGVVQLWRWLARHETDVRQRWSAVLQHPWVVSARRRLTPLRAFIEARLSPQGYVGVRLTVGALVLIAASWVFGGIAASVVARRPLTVIDARLATWLHAGVTPGLTTVMLAISAVGSPAVVGAFTALLAVVLWWRREWYRLLALVLTVPGGMLLNVLLQSAFHRARPQLGNPHRDAHQLRLSQRAHHGRDRVLRVSRRACRVPTRRRGAGASWPCSSAAW